MKYRLVTGRGQFLVPKVTLVAPYGLRVLACPRLNPGALGSLADYFMSAFDNFETAARGSRLQALPVLARILALKAGFT